MQSLPPRWCVLLWEHSDIYELEGAHFVVELTSPSAYWWLLNDLDNITFL